MELCRDISKINTVKYNTVLSIRSNLELIERLNKYINLDICKTPKHKTVSRFSKSECNDIKLYLQLLYQNQLLMCSLLCDINKQICKDDNKIIDDR